MVLRALCSQPRLVDDVLTPRQRDSYRDALAGRGGVPPPAQAPGGLNLHIIYVGLEAAKLATLFSLATAAF